MRKAVAILGLVLMAVGIMLTAFGTQTKFVSQQPVQFTSGCSNCVTLPPLCDFFGASNPCLTLQYSLTPSVPQPVFTLNYVGMFLAVLGSVFFAMFYPKRPSISLPTNAISLGL